MQTEAQRRAKDRYDAKTARQVKMKLNMVTDADIIDRLEKSGNVQGYIKALIRADIEARPDLFA